MRTAKTLRYLAFALMTLFGALGGLFAAGYAFDDPGGWAAIAIVVGWLVPVVALSMLAAWRPTLAGPVLMAVTALVILFSWSDTILRVIPKDSWGPVGSISLLGLGVAIGFLGLNRARLAGWLLVIAGLAQLLGIVLGSLGRGSDGRPLGAMLGGSSGVVVLPILIIGALFLIAGSLRHEPLFRATGVPKPAH